MKKIAFTTGLLLFFSCFCLKATEAFVRHNDKNFGFSLLIPHDWKRTDINLIYKHIIYITKGNHSCIKISSTEIDDEEKDKWKSWKEWYIRGIGCNFGDIVETKNVKISGRVKGRLLIFEYNNKKRKKILQRILIAEYKNKILVIECSSTLKNFYKLNNTFNTVMGSLIFK